MITQDIANADQRRASTITVVELAVVMGVTPRRVSQMCKDGELIKRGRGLVDAPHAVIAVAGGRWLGRASWNASSYTKAGVGWLLGHQKCGIGPKELEVWYDLAAQWGLNRAQATVELLNASALLGKNGLTLRAGVGRIKDTDG